MTLLPLLLTFHFVFLFYLLISGAGFARALGVWKQAFLQPTPLVGLALIGVITMITGNPSTFPRLLLFMSAFALPFAALRVVPDVVTPRIGLMEVVLTNVVAIVLTGVRIHIRYLPDLAVGLHWLLNPFHLLMPASTMANLVVSLWPSLLAVALARRGPPGDPRLRLILVLWTQLVGFIWLVPVAVSAILHFDASSFMAYVQSVAACVATVHAVLLGINLRRALGGEKRYSFEEPSQVTQTLADSLRVNRWPWWIFAAGGALGYVGAVRLRAVMVDPVLLVSTAYIAAITLGAIAVRTGAPVDDVLDEPQATRARKSEAKPIAWRSYRGTLATGAVGVLVLAGTHMLDSEAQFLSGEARVVSQILAGGWIFGAFMVLNALLVFAWIFAEAMGKHPTRGARLVVLLAGILVLGGWRWLTLPSPHPEGGLDGSELAYHDSRVYFWYAEEGVFGGGTGRVVYVENLKSGERHKLRPCGGYPGSQPVQSIRIVLGMIECRWPDRVTLVDEKGESRHVSWGGIDPPKITPISAAARRCWLLDSPTVSVACAAPVGEHPRTFVPLDTAYGQIAWQPGAARYFTLEFAHREPTVCVEVPARAKLPDGYDGTVVFVVEFSNSPDRAAALAPSWIVDLEGSCARMGENINGQPVYQWSELTAPYRFSSHGEPSRLVPMSGSGQENRPET